MGAPNGLVVFISGFGTGSVGQLSSNNPDSTGVGILAKQSFLNDMQKGVFAWDEQKRIVEYIRDFHQNNHDGPIHVVGHSFGADSAIEVAEQLKAEDIRLDKLVMIDSVGANDDKVPENVLDALNIYSTSGDGINGEYPVEGARNLGLDNTSHTAIDNDPRTWEAIQNFFGPLVTEQFNDLNEQCNSTEYFTPSELKISRMEEELTQDGGSDQLKSESADYFTPSELESQSHSADEQITHEGEVQQSDANDYYVPSEPQTSESEQPQETDNNEQYTPESELKVSRTEGELTQDRGSDQLKSEATDYFTPSELGSQSYAPDEQVSDEGEVQQSDANDYYVPSELQTSESEQPQKTDTEQCNSETTPY